MKSQEANVKEALMQKHLSFGFTHQQASKLQKEELVKKLKAFNDQDVSDSKDVEQKIQDYMNQTDYKIDKSEIDELMEMTVHAKKLSNFNKEDSILSTSELTLDKFLKGILYKNFGY